MEMRSYLYNCWFELNLIIEIESYFYICEFKLNLVMRVWMKFKKKDIMSSVKKKNVCRCYELNLN
jgi:hypothetical protein